LATQAAAAAPSLVHICQIEAGAHAWKTFRMRTSVSASSSSASTCREGEHVTFVSLVPHCVIHFHWISAFPPFHILMGSLSESSVIGLGDMTACGSPECCMSV